ncbi:sulfurtransferase [Tepidibacter hydrothermalis]|uniref:thiosulfate sulfurtransferase n=1 Tax=Tepidibacter hydrothermalis TaxID=3036126 RepID=A0ABY8EED9_9FIRM|nr:sulfurtransferase [Tepidibacter hydrothermalis]WFD09949.1 sulfurtransferase [Tepidibacter hydrothermalis]
MRNFVDCAWVEKHMDDEELFIIDCRFGLFDASYGKGAYAKGHIKNAFYLDINEDLSGAQKAHGGARPVPELSILGKKLEKMGLRMDSQIVCYDDRTYSSARGWWQLKNMGFENVYILNGGYEAWKQLGLPISKECPEARQGGSIKIEQFHDIYCDIEYVKKAMLNSNIVLLDSREHRRYTGEYEPLYSKNGHIPGAMNLHWQKNVKDDGRLKERSMLEKNFSFVNSKMEIITYCGSGIDGALNFVILDELGYKVRLYVGSISDWISYEENILECV